MAYDERIFKQKIEVINDEFDEMLKAHPKFMEVLQKGYEIVSTLNECTNYKIVTFDEGKSVRIYAYGHKETGTELVDNSEITSFTISIDEKGTLITDLSDGVLYKASDLNYVLDTNINTEEYPSRIYATYQGICYDEFGIEMSRTEYQDTFDLNEQFEEVDLDAEVLASYHKPRLTTIPVELPFLCENASYIQTNRTKNEIGIGYRSEIKGIHKRGNDITIEDIENTLCLIDTASPETLSVISSTPVATQNKNTKEYEVQMYAIFGNNIWEAKQKMNETFKNGIEKSELKETNPKQYQVLCEYIETSHQK